MEIEEAKKELGIEFSFFFEEIINPVIQVLNLDKNAKILDIDTGEGKMAISLALNGYKVLTGEPESDESEYAKQDWLNSAKKVRVNNLITFKEFNAEKMPFEDNSFDAIFLMGAFHHIDDKTSAFNECVRIMSKNGVLCIFEPNHRGLKIIKKRHPTHPDGVDPREYAGELSVEIKKSALFNIYIMRNR